MALEIRPEEIGRFDPAVYQGVRVRLGLAPHPAPPIKARPVKLYDEPIGPIRVVIRDYLCVKSHPSSVDVFRYVRNAALAKYDLTLEQFEGTQRNADVAKCRREVWYYVHKNTKLSLPKIGQLSGGRDHSTILYAIARYEELEFGEPNHRLDSNRARSRARHTPKRPAAIVEG